MSGPVFVLTLRDVVALAVFAICLGWVLVIGLLARYRKWRHNRRPWRDP